MARKSKAVSAKAGSKGGALKSKVSVAKSTPSKLALVSTGAKVPVSKAKAKMPVSALAAPVAKKSGKAVAMASIAPQGPIEKAKAALKTVAKEEKKAAIAVEPTKPAAKSRSKKITIDASANEAASALSAKWQTLYKKAEQIESKPYNMKAVFEEKTAITHKVLGWGYILSNRNDRLEVLFKDGIKYLISNYKP